MSKRSDDPRRLPGGMIGPGGPHDKGGVILDTRYAVLMSNVDVSTIDPEEANPDRGSVIALLLSGRVNQTKDQASVLFIFGTDGAAAIITQLLALMGRSTGIDPTQLLNDIMNRMAELRAAGELS